MQRKSFGNMQCPIARSLERVGEWWSILILRDAFHGLTRFDQFQKSLGIAPNMLTRRLNGLVEAGLLERRRYSEHPPRDEYVLTERGARLSAGAVGAPRLGQQALRARGRERRHRRRRRRAPSPILCVVDRSSGRPLDRRQASAPSPGLPPTSARGAAMHGSTRSVLSSLHGANAITHARHDRRSIRVERHA